VSAPAADIQRPITMPMSPRAPHPPRRSFIVGSELKTSTLSRAPAAPVAVRSVPRATARSSAGLLGYRVMQHAAAAVSNQHRVSRRAANPLASNIQTPPLALRLMMTALSGRVYPVREARECCREGRTGDAESGRESAGFIAVVAIECAIWRSRARAAYV